MPIIKSAKKRVRVSAKATTRNSKTRRSVRESVKELKKAIAGGKAKEIEQAQKEAVSAIDTAEKKNVIHKNKAARKKSQLSSAVKAAGVKPSATKKAPAKPVAKKSPAKKPAAKKPVAKKPAAKKATK